MKPPPKKVHLYYVRTAFLTTVLCQPFANESWIGRAGDLPQTTEDPAQVTCRRCLHKMQWLRPAPGMDGQAARRSE